MIHAGNKTVHPFGESFNLFGWYPGWLATYIILSIGLSTLFRKLFDVSDTLDVLLMKDVYKKSREYVNSDDLQLKDSKPRVIVGILPYDKKAGYFSSQLQI